MGWDMQPQGQQPIFIMQEGTQQKRGRNAQGNNISAARAVGDAVRSTLGPKGMDKMLVDSTGQVIITNDGATILREVGIEHPAAKMVVEVAKTQESRCHDGTTSAVVLASELLRNAEELLEKGIHPTTITAGYRKGLECALETVNELSRRTGLELDEKIPLESIARTALTGKSAESSKVLLSKICVNAVKAVSSLEDIRILTITGGGVGDTRLFNGVALEKDKAHPRMENNVTGKIVVLSCAIEAKQSNIEAQVQITDPKQVADFLAQEENAIKEMVNRIESLGAVAVFCQKGIDELAIHYFRRHGILAVEKVVRSDLDAICKATGASMVSDISDLGDDDLGESNVEVVNDYDMPFIRVSSTATPSPVSVIAFGSTPHVAAEIERALDDALGVSWLAHQTDSAVIVGGGAPHAHIATHIDRVSHEIAKGRERMAVESFGNSMMIIPQTIGENAGLDPVDVALLMDSEHREDEKWASSLLIDGEDETGTAAVCDAIENMIIEPASVIIQALKSATEAAIMILRIDDVIMMRSEGPNQQGLQMG
jgi:chaperonin GroEL (HSP60 family)